MDIQVTATVPQHQQPAMRPVSSLEVWPYLLPFGVIIGTCVVVLLFAEGINVITRRMKR